MRILVSPASKHGSTAEIGRAIARRVRSHGIDVDVTQPENVRDVSPYDGFVIGSALYMGTWTAPARHFVDEFGDQLASRPTWLFSSGPVGESKPDQPLREGVVDGLMTATDARGHELFGGRMELARLSRTDRFVARWVGAADGDDRDWEAIDVWADTVATALLADDESATDRPRPVTGANQ